MPRPNTPKRTLTLKPHLVCELGYHERLLASEGWSLWTCQIQERPDPLTPIEDLPIERRPDIEIEREPIDFPDVDIERQRPGSAD